MTDTPCYSILASDLYKKPQDDNNQESQYAKNDIGNAFSTSSPSESQQTAVMAAPLALQPPTVSVSEIEVSTDASPEGDIRAIHSSANAIFLAMTADRSTRLFYAFKLTQKKPFDTPQRIIIHGKSSGTITLREALEKYFLDKLSIWCFHTFPLPVDSWYSDALEVQNSFDKLTGASRIVQAHKVMLEAENFKDGDLIQITARFGMAINGLVKQFELLK